MLGALLGFMTANPATSHALTALPETAGFATAMIGLRTPRPEATAALVVSTYQLGRGVRQREHDIKHAGWDAVQAHLGANSGTPDRCRTSSHGWRRTAPPERSRPR